MSTTTIRIEEELKQRLAAAAELSGKTPHAFILEAIAQTVEQVEIETAFDRVADERWSRMLDTGKTVPWDATKAYLEARARGDKARRPAARAFKR
jgi:predicted transcriptional regulator